VRPVRTGGHGELLESGDRLVKPLQLTSSRWQILGAIALADSPRSAPQLAAQMGMTRQGAQKQLDFCSMMALWTLQTIRVTHARRCTS
jgi:hypothetical protein